MKKTLIVLSLSALLIISGCKWSKNVVEYNDTFVSIVKECTDSNQSLFETFQDNSSTTDSIIASLQYNINICETAKDQAIKLWDYEKDSSLKDAVVRLLSMEVDYLKKFWETSRYWDIDNITDEDRAVYEGLTNDLYAAEEALNAQFVSLQESQEGFAVKHWLKLE